MPKKTKKRVARKMPKATKELVIRVEQTPSNSVSEKDLGPQIQGGKYMMPKTWMSERQVVFMAQKTPVQHIYTRPGKGGGNWTYVTQSYIVKVLNFVFGWNWDFEIIEQGREQDQIWVKGKLTVKSPTGQEITKTQFGRAEVKFKKNTKEMLDYGNDLKSAGSDALKKCASLLGIASDVYGKLEMKKEANKDVRDDNMPTYTMEAENIDPKDIVPGKIIPLKPGQVVGPDNKPVYLCSVGGEIISEAEYIYSTKMLKKALCREHQKNGK